MASINFPNSPSVDDEYTFNGVTYIYKGSDIWIVKDDSDSLVTLTGNQTLTNKTLTNPTLTGYTETVCAIVDAASVAVNPANGTIQTGTLGASRTLTTGSIGAGQSVLLMINDGTAYALTWTTVVWVGGTAPTLATTGFTVIELWKVGSTCYGALVGEVA